MTATRVYFIEAGDRQAYKIGFSNDPLQRMKDLQQATHLPLRLAVASPGGRSEEGRLHRRFKDFKISGEWFRGCIGLLWTRAALHTTGLTTKDFLDRTEPWKGSPWPSQPIEDRIFDGPAPRNHMAVLERLLAGGSFPGLAEWCAEVVAGHYE